LEQLGAPTAAAHTDVWNGLGLSPLAGAVSFSRAHAVGNGLKAARAVLIRTLTFPFLDIGPAILMGEFVGSCPVSERGAINGNAAPANAPAGAVSFDTVTRPCAGADRPET
jgi:hypothetical protein